MASARSYIILVYMRKAEARNSSVIGQKYTCNVQAPSHAIEDVDVGTIETRQPQVCLCVRRICAGRFTCEQICGDGKKQQASLRMSVLDVHGLVGII